MKVNGKMIYNMGRVNRAGLTIQNIKGNINKEKNMGLEHMFGVTNQHSLECGLRIKLRER